MILPGKDDGLHERVQWCRAGCEVTLQAGLEAISESAQRRAVATARTGQRGCK